MVTRRVVRVVGEDAGGGRLLDGPLALARRQSTGRLEKRPRDIGADDRRDIDHMAGCHRATCQPLIEDGGDPREVSDRARHDGP
jgi:hypothetical protein